MKQGAVVGLDLATVTGAAWHHPSMPRPFFEAFRLPGEARDIGKRCDYLERWLRDKYIQFKPLGGISHFFVEEQHLGQVSDGKGRPKRTVNPATIKLLAGLSATTQKFAYQVGAHCYEVGISEWRKHFLGIGAGFKARGEDPKEMCIQRAAEYGWHTDVADAAEALGILDFSLTLIPDYDRPWRDKALMGGRL